MLDFIHHSPKFKPMSKIVNLRKLKFKSLKKSLQAFFYIFVIGLDKKSNFHFEG